MTSSPADPAAAEPGGAAVPAGGAGRDDPPVVAVVGGCRLYLEAVADLLSAADRWQVRVGGPGAAPEAAGPAVLVVVDIGADASVVPPPAGVPSVVVVCDAPSWSVNHPDWPAGATTVVDATSPGSLVVAVTTAAGGDRTGRSGPRSKRGTPGSGLGGLTRREAEILRLTAAGTPAPQVAAHLGISPHTVRTHLQSCMSKLEVHSRAEMVSVARAAGLRPDPAGRRQER